MSIIEAPANINTFDLDSYFESRDSDPNFVLVEIGHDATPIAYLQPTEFKGQRAYIGIESWLRDPSGNKITLLAEQHSEEANGQNIFYVKQPQDGTVSRDEDMQEAKESWYSGPYDTETMLPDGAASEVVLGNVLSDPHIAWSKEATSDLLKEASRLIDEEGYVIVRETMRPERITHLSNELISASGLEPVAFYTPADTETWNKIKAHYGTGMLGSSKPAPECFCMILRKAAAS